MQPPLCKLPVITIPTTGLPAMQRRRCLQHAVVGLLACAMGLPGHAKDTLREAGALLWEMGDIYSDFGYQHIARGMTPDKVQAMADKAAGKLARHRDALAELLPDLDSQTRLGQDLPRFLDGWPDRAAFRDDLLRFGKNEKLGRALGGLKFQVSDPRSQWRTPFPLFRP